MSTKQYIGTKVIQAEPAVRYQGKVFALDDTIPIQAVVNNEVEHGYKVTYQDGYVSWSPAAVFEEAYRETNGMSFGLAVEAMKKGARIARWAWGASERYVYLATDVQYHTAADISEFEDWDNGVFVGDMLVHRTEEKTFAPGWVPSQSDILADDWYVVDRYDPAGERTKLPI